MQASEFFAKTRLARHISICATFVLLAGVTPSTGYAAEDETEAVVDDGQTAESVKASKHKKSAKDLDENLDEVVISATKTATAVSNAPAAVTVIGQKDMETKNISRLGDALTKVPSLYLGFPALGQTQGSSGSGGFSLRGANTQRTLVLVDGQPLQDSNSSSVDWRTVMTDDIEKVEVVPGAFSSLYGSSAMGGVINVITKRASKHELTVRGKKGFQDAEGEDGSIYLRERLDNGLGITAGFSYQDRDSYMNEYNVRSLSSGTVNRPVTGAIPTTTSRGVDAYIVGEKGRSPWTQMNATAKLDYDFSNGDRIHAGWSFSDYQMGYSPLNSYLRDGAGNTVTSGTRLGIDGHRLNLNESTFVTSAPLNSASNRYFGGYEHHFTSDVVLKTNVAFIDREYSFSTVDTTGTTQYNGSGVLTDVPNNGLDTDMQLNFPLRFGHMPFAKDHVFVTGANLHRETVDRGAFKLTNWRQSDSVTSLKNAYTGDSKIYSLYAQDEISVFDPLTVYLGGRMNWWETEGDFKQFDPLVASAKYQNHGTTNFSPKFSGVYKPIDELTFRTSWGTAFRAPANADMYSTSVISSTTAPSGKLTTQGDPNLKPETATTWEAGGEWHISPKVKIGSTYYETVITDMIYSKNVSLDLTQKINAGKARIRGVEFTFGSKPVEWLELFANYGYVDSRMLSNPADEKSVGKRLTTVPKHAIKAGFIASYQDWSGSMEMNHFSHQYVQSDNSDYVDNVPGSPSEYTLLNAKLGYKINDMIKLNTAVNNLTDEKFYQFYLMPGINLTTEIVLSF